MFHRLSNTNNQRGEVAWLLTIVSMVVIGVGLVIGFNISTQEQAAIRVAPQAQEVTPAPSKKLLTEPVDNLPRVCFPFQKDASGKPARVSDPFCLARLVPVQFTRRTLTASGIDLLSQLKKTDFVTKKQVNTLDNPFTNVVPPASDLTKLDAAAPTSFSFNGGLCLREDEIQNFDVSGWNIYLSPFYVRKYESTTNTGATEFDTFDATIVDANKLVAQAVDGNIRYTTDAAPTANQKGNQICNYKKGNPATVKSSANYPVLFKVPFTYSQLLQKINKPDLKGHPDVQGFDTQECSLYLHARRAGQSEGDIWNIAKVPLADIIGQAAAALVCPPPTTITIEPPLTITPSETPTPSESPTPSPESLSCTQACVSGDMCGTYEDPITGTTEQLGCLDTSDANITTVCDINSGFNCQCAPTKCVGPKGICSPEELACGKSPITVTPPPPTVTVTPPPPTITAEPQDLVCAYNALAFVEECLVANPKTGVCEVTGPRNIAQAISQNVLDPEPNDTNRTKKWGATNDLQLANVRSDGTPGFRPAGLIPASLFKYYDANSISPLVTRFQRFQFNNAPISAIDLSSIQYVKPINKTERKQIEELLYRKDIRIQHASALPEDPTNRFPAEQYVNFSAPAKVQLQYDNVNYNILKDGKKVYSCTNDLKEKLKAMDGIPTSDPSKRDVSACAAETDTQSYDLDTIYGLNVGCGQNIVYGWTLKKCTFDFDIVLVVDTSSSMTYSYKDESGRDIQKLATAKEQLKEFVSFAAAKYGKNTRISLVSFNKADKYEPGTNPEVTGGITTHNQALHNHPKYVPITDQNGISKLNAAIDSLQTAEGTCIQCGLRDAKSILDNRSEPSKRMPVVIFLSDGKPNSFHGQADPNPGNDFAEIYGLADGIRNDYTTTDPTGVRIGKGIDSDVSDDVLFIGFGYGDAKAGSSEADGLFFDILNNMTSTRRDADGNLIPTKRWIYATDRNTNASPIEVAGIVDQISADLNSCSQLNLAAETVLKAKDVDQNGIVNILDLTAIFDNYFAKGTALKEDINSDGVVNISDAVLVIDSLGTVVTPANKPVTGAEVPTQPAQ